MKRIKTYVSVILEIHDEDNEDYNLELIENSVSSEINHLENMAWDAFINGEYKSLDEIEGE